MENTTFQKIDGKIVETTTIVIEHNPQDLLSKLQNQLDSMVSGKNEYLATVNANITELENKIAELQQLINL